MSLYYPKVWTAHILEAVRPKMWFEWPKVRFLGVFATESQAADKVREKRTPGFDKEGWVAEWDVKAGECIFRVTVFDNGEVPK